MTELKKAFWRTFIDEGEIYFSEDPEDEMINRFWNKFLKELEKDNAKD